MVPSIRSSSFGLFVATGCLLATIGGCRSMQRLNRGKAITFETKEEREITVEPSFNQDCRRGVRYLRVEDWNGAISAFEKALESDPDDHFASYGMGASFEGKGDFCSAAKHYSDAATGSEIPNEEWIASYKYARKKCDSK